ncbi:sensor domain-containing diguanylate cyclase [Wenzhouxiangella limi]|uniref:diguanylate cyclase n=1 Tax=Wenzhouxiangella limi TaxID=2707351 RepID=A0A845UXZ1_9GAMM|nr:GGDEF domain-containing protein [Wenzhouxiangella limi]NDY95374.1 diguanylate cyclase [Wenzhouxiangella limi]
MFFRSKRSPEDRPDPAELEKRLAALGDRETACQSAIQTLLVLLKNFALELDELKSADFRSQVTEFSEQLPGLETGDQMRRAMNKRSQRFEAFIERQNTYLLEREAELRKVITLLSNAMALLNRENAAYHQQILDQGTNFERIIALDDLRKIKTSLAEEVRQLKSMVEQKKQAESQQLNSLSGQVEVLRDELEKTRDENRRDPLTGIFNRRAMDEYLTSLIDGNRIRRKSFSVLMLDIDNFKVVNDQHGHLVGDQVISAMAGACVDILREDDFVARFGGEEFVAVMPGASLRAAGKRAGNLRQAVAGTRFSLPVDDREDYLHLTVSIGVTDFRAGDTRQSLLERADQALYQAKAAGKNQVVTL